MKMLSTILLMALAVFGLWAQDEPAAGGAKGKGKAGVGGKGGRGVAKQKAAEPPAPPHVPQVMRLLRPSLYLVTGRGANVLFRLTPDGIILVNSKQPGDADYQALLHFIEGVTWSSSKTPAAKTNPNASKVQMVLNSSAAPEATGNNERFGQAGAAIMTGASTARLGGVEARAIPFGENTAIYLPADRVVYLGDLYAAGAGAKAPAGAAAAIDALLKLDWTVAVPSSGEPVYRNAVETYRKTL